MLYVGDFTAGKTVWSLFNTRAAATGAPITLAGTPVVSVYKNSTTESTAGVTLTVDYDARTGMHQWAVDTSADAAFYANGNDFRVVLTAGTVDGVSQVGVVLAQFSLANRSGLRPTTADLTLDVAATGEAGLDFSNIKQATGATTLTNIIVPRVTLVDTTTTNTDMRGTDNAALAATALSTAVWTGTIAGRIDAAISSRMATFTQPTGFLAADFTRLDVAVSSRMATFTYTAPDNATIATIAGYLDTEVAAIKLVTDHLGTALVLDGAVYQFTANALELAPSGGGSGLSGPSTVTLTFRDALNTPVPLVDFTIVGQGPGRSDVSGVAVFGLANGTYTVVSRAAGLLFSNATLTVSGATALTITGTAVAPITPPADPSLCQAQGYLRRIDGTIGSNLKVRFSLAAPIPARAGALVVQSIITATSDSEGLVTVQLIRTDTITPAGARYNIQCESVGLDKTVELNTPTFDLATLIP